MMYLFYYIPKNINNKVSYKTLLYLLAKLQSFKIQHGGVQVFFVPCPATCARSRGWFKCISVPRYRQFNLIIIKGPDIRSASVENS